MSRGSGKSGVCVRACFTWGRMNTAHARVLAGDFVFFCGVNSALVSKTKVIAGVCVSCEN